MTGRCLCGQVSYRIDAAPLYAGHCFCTDCRRVSGSGHMTAFGVAKAALHIEGELAFYRSTGGSGKIVTRAFCPTCGSLISSQSEARPPDIVNVTAGTLDDPSLVKPSFAVFCRSRAPWDALADDVVEYQALPA
ncbi:GFA family protein [Bradyrhizobium jicamae]|uniref:GFA family protein n=1 Tax=Bradyrhizobium jicamae TaxID=280332 RepID=A0ABS5FNY9_9BRAD|nr:GFA family protein [Bradyrhizobium jicamae]MBR0798525.1 GFA family protein [Bradyrhizobium jicamae]MBR0937162.1 GFA family protein [Bradyrhizobium jicamae]